MPTLFSAERRLLANQLSRIHEQLRAKAEDNAWWDAAIDNIHLNENQQWMADIVGEATTSFNDIDGSFVIRPDDSIAYQHDPAEPPNIQSMLSEGLSRAIIRLNSADLNAPISASGYLLSDGRLYVIAISMVQPTGVKTYDPPIAESRRSIIAFYQRIDETAALEVGNAIGLEGLEFIAGDELTFDGASLANIAGQTIGQFSWSPATPGADVLYRLIAPATLFFGIILLAMLVFVARARKLMEELEQASRAKMAFLASMSHEVRTPLNAIIGFAEIIRLELPQTKENEETHQHLDLIRSSGEHLLTIINDILNISKLDAEKMEIFPEAMDPVEVISESVRMMSGAASEKSIRLVDDLESSMIHSDERLIRQILLNLLSNAIKFTPPEGQVSVRSEIAGDRYRITVSDTGAGMAKEDIALALEPFGQVGEDGRLEGGTGLGLPLVNRFTNLLGGDLAIRSAPGHGTSVTIELPEANPNLGGAKPKRKTPNLL